MSFLSGGLAGARLNEWYRQKHSRLQKIPLIERVNRLVSPKLQRGITLARAVGEGPDRQLEELNNLREYQLTLRNTSTVHLPRCLAERPRRIRRLPSRPPVA